mmetsp:Transcript_24733/g.32298  ORF Transcript_24733/g.32298 Transcript_24733/m.32298 type:complete len:323 (+) Transcript_24733:114-1082(+)
MGSCCTCLNRFSNLIVFSLMVATTYLGVFGSPFQLVTEVLDRFGYDGENFLDVALKYPSLLNPDWTTFPLVMGGVFVFEAFFILWQLCARDTNPHLRTGVSWWFFFACIFQALWSVAFIQEMILASAILMFLVCKCLHIILLRVTVIDQTPGAPGPGCCGSTNIWIPIGMHAAAAGWFFVMNTMMCVQYLFDSAAVHLAVAILALSCVWSMNIFITVYNRNIWYGLTAVWALYCIAQHMPADDSGINTDMATALNYVCYVYGAILSVVSVCGGTCLRGLMACFIYCFTGNPNAELPSYIVPSEESDVNTGKKRGANYRAVAT